MNTYLQTYSNLPMLTDMNVHSRVVKLKMLTCLFCFLRSAANLAASRSSADIPFVLSPIRRSTNSLDLVMVFSSRNSVSLR